MTRVSLRYVPHIVLLLAVLTPLALLQNLDRRLVEDCANPGALAPVGAAWRTQDDDPLVSEQEARRRHYLSYTSADGRWAEGTIPLEDGGHLSYLVLRSYYPRRIYLRGAAALTETPIDHQEVERVEGPTGPLPVHRVVPGHEDRGRTLTSYVLVYESRPVANPLLAQLRAAPRELLLGRKPMTLFFVTGEVAPRRFDEAQSTATHWLVDAWRRYDTVCEEPSTSS